MGHLFRRALAIGKKAIEKFSGHESSYTHSYAVSQLQQCKTAPVIAQVSKQKEKQQQDARKALLKMLSSLKYLARQGLAIRGHWPLLSAG